MKASKQTFILSNKHLTNQAIQSSVWIKHGAWELNLNTFKIVLCFLDDLKTNQSLNLFCFWFSCFVKVILGFPCLPPQLPPLIKQHMLSVASIDPTFLLITVTFLHPKTESLKVSISQNQTVNQWLLPIPSLK